MDEKLKSLIKFNEDLQAIIDPVLLEKEFDPKGQKEHFLIYSLGKGYKTHSAILLLCKNGYGQDSAVLTRSLFELAVTTLYIQQDTTEGRAERWLDYDWIRRDKLYEYIKSEERFTKHLEEKMKDLTDKNPPVEIKKMAQEAQEKHKYLKGLGWSDKNIFDMSDSVGLKDIYSTVYKLQSELHHSGVGSVNDYFSIEESAIIFDIGPSPKWIEETLVASFHFFSILVKEWNDSLKLSLDSEIESLVKKWVQEIGDPVPKS